MEEQESKDTPAHLASVFADILNPENEEKEEIKIDTISKRSINKKKKKLKKKSSEEKEIEKKNSNLSKKRKIDQSSLSSSSIDKSKREWENLNRSKPDPIVDRELERSLTRIATKGVVQLFNAIREHQSLVDDAVNEKNTTTSRMEKKVKSIVKKNNFLDLVESSSKSSTTTSTKNKNRKEESMDVDDESKSKSKTVKIEDDDGGKKKWDVLRDDFLLNSTKDWDKDE